MTSLRTISTRRLAAWIGAIVVLGLCGGAIALAAGGGGPTPPPKPLARAAHDALAAPAPAGITARVRFTNHLLGSSTFEGSDPILTGASGRMWLTKGHLRLELQSSRGDAQVVADDRTIWAYDPRSNTVYRGDTPHEFTDRAETSNPAPSVADVQRFIDRLMNKAGVSGATPVNVAGRPAYEVRLSPKPKAGLVSNAALAWDAANGVPLRVGIFAVGSSTPVLELTATDVSFGSVPSSTFDVTPPQGAKVVNVSAPSGSGGGKDEHPAGFSVSAPATLAGLPRNEVKHLDGGQVLVTYGRDLGGIGVLEQAAKPGADSGQAGGGGDFNLPGVSINGATGQELSTPLGTVVQFQRGGVSFTVAGSVPRAKAEAAARGL